MSLIVIINFFYIAVLNYETFLDKTSLSDFGLIGDFFSGHINGFILLTLIISLYFQRTSILQTWKSIKQQAEANKTISQDLQNSIKANMLLTKEFITTNYKNEFNEELNYIKLLMNKMEIQKQRLMLSKISSERDMLTKANEILDKQAERFFKKSYPSLNIDKFSNHEVRAMVNETLFRKQLLNKDQLAEVIYNERVVEKEESKKIFKEKPFQTSRYLDSKIKQVEDSITKENNPERKEILSIKKEKLIGIKQGLIEYVQSEVERKFDKNVSIDSVIEGEMLLAKADYYKTTDFSKVEGVARFSSEEINSMLEQSKGFLTNIQTVKIPNDCQGVFFVQDSMKHIDELSPLAKHNLKKVVNRNAYLPDSDKIELSKEIENTNKDQSQEC